MSSEIDKLLLAERKNKRWLAELRMVRKKYGAMLDTPERTRVLKVIDAEIATALK